VYSSRTRTSDDGDSCQSERRADGGQAHHALLVHDLLPHVQG
jgi:hypothetical protein